MKRFFLILLTLVSLGVDCFAQGAVDMIPVKALTAEQLQKLECYLDEVVNAYHVPGMACVITNQEGALFEKAFGECTSLDQQFYIGSMSKSYTLPSGL